MPRSLQLGLLFAFLAVVAGVVVVHNTPAPSTPASTATSTPARAGTVQLIIGSSSPITVSVTGTTTVLSMMQAAASSSPSFTYRTSSYPSLGAYVSSINGVKGAGTSYWTYLINGTSATAGISTQLIAPGDTVTWQYHR